MFIDTYFYNNYILRKKWFDMGFLNKICQNKTFANKVGPKYENSD